MKESRLGIILLLSIFSALASADPLHHRLFEPNCGGAVVMDLEPNLAKLNQYQWLRQCERLGERISELLHIRTKGVTNESESSHVASLLREAEYYSNWLEKHRAPVATRARQTVRELNNQLRSLQSQFSNNGLKLD